MKLFKSSKFFILFLCILAISAFLRLYRLSTVPPGANRDEASIGYTAFSLLKTGKDEYARPFPLSFQSFGDWKLPLYIYTDVPFVALFGTNELAIRLPSALAGITAVGVLFFLVVELTGSQTLGLVSMAVLAISPWHLHLSRVESESNVAVLLMSLALLTFLKSIHHHKPKLLLASAVLFALPYFTYAGNHVTTTLILLGIIFIYRKDIPKTKNTFLAGSIFLLLSAIIFFATFTGADTTKISGISIFGDPTVVHEKIELKRLEHPDPNSIIPRLLHNRIVYAAETIGQNYIKAFSPQFLFISGGTNHAHNIADFGNMYLIEAPFFLFGVAVLLSLLQKKEFALILWWIAVSPVAASITKDAPHSNRMFAIFPMLSVVVALGIVWLFGKFKKHGIKNYLIALIVGLYVINMAIYLDRYYFHFPRNESIYWGTGYKALYQVLSSDIYKNKHVVMTHPETSPYIYFLLYSSYDPTKYFASVVRYPPTPDAFVHVKHFDRFDFRDINWQTDIQLKNTLLIASSDEIPQSIKDHAYTKIDISLPNGRTQFTIIEMFKP